jgi:hypothetical protein
MQHSELRVSGAAGFIIRWITANTRSTTEVMVMTQAAPHSNSCLMPITVRNPPRYKKLRCLGWILRSNETFELDDLYKK